MESAIETMEKLQMLQGPRLHRGRGEAERLHDIADEPDNMSDGFLSRSRPFSKEEMLPDFSHINRLHGDDGVPSASFAEPHRFHPQRDQVRMLSLQQIDQVNSFQNGDPLESNPEEVRSHENSRNARWLNL